MTTNPAPASRPRTLTALPVFNEVRHVTSVLDQVVRNAGDVLVVDDGSTDGTRDVLAQRSDVIVVTHAENRGYGAALRTAFDYAVAHGYDVLVTIDCDGQHEPQRIQQLVDACEGVDIVSGSRYLGVEINCRLNLKLTDAFCGFKAYRVEALKKLRLTDSGYAMPLELWVQAAFHGLKIVELAVPLIYLDEKRSFGGSLDDSGTRLAYYHAVIERAVQACRSECRPHVLPTFQCTPMYQGCR
jgi:glycosyltransferase involved in cell wall biosynthesis